ncbi:16S rRNA (guanine(966)-N(2))-methyltransferase RsmD [Halioxenophilus sp. WMMB6]|uniref:16S rRNA (guanine(966)-N(2))-methyltransferase RsmD n=1 Tax=Halioxenophilus sp. WMMB6 TaxID=3073815 RepID=UPI00295E7CD0|nr:16S rRNA (guanine(966)-N(2))-methyltransferase RsmD [Halioxenophilus sp. WMMB6]
MTRHSKPRHTADGQLRIIAGQWRGRKLAFPALDGLRPTGDRIRETLFNWLQAELPGARCLDLFAGSGALGLEALSRGAAHCTFIDSQASACQALKANLAKLSCTAAQVLQTDAVTWLQQSAASLHSGQTPVQVVFCDPPFAKGLWAEAIEALAASPLLASDAWIYIETPKDEAVTVPVQWRLHRSKTAGTIRFQLFQVAG